MLSDRGKTAREWGVLTNSNKGLWKMPTCGLGHLLAIEQQVSVAAHALRPFGLVLLPDGCVVIQGKAEMVVDQVLAGCLHTCTDTCISILMLSASQQPTSIASHPLQPLKE